MRNLFCLLFLFLVPVSAGAAALGAGDLETTLKDVSAVHPDAPEFQTLWRAAMRGVVEELGVEDAGPLLFRPDRARLEAVLKDLPEARATAVVRAGLRTALAWLDDPGSRLYSPGEYTKELKTLGVGDGGVGFLIEPKADSQGRYRIARLIPGFPAETVGIKEGDYLVGVGLSKTSGLTFEQLATRVKGPVGTSVRLQIQRGDAPPKTVEITRQWLDAKPPAPKTSLLGKDIGYLRLDHLGFGTRQLLEEAVDTLRQDGADRLVLDLRECRGELSGTAGAAELFLPPGKLVYLVLTQKEVERVTTSAGAVAAQPLVVLVGPKTGQSAAVLAGALRDQGRAVIVGQPTEPAQTRSLRWAARELPDDWIVTYSVARVRLPSGQGLWDRALIPDLVVPDRADRPLEEALKLLKR